MTEGNLQLTDLPKRARTKRKAHGKALRQGLAKQLDERVHTLHEQTFAEIDCLACANCCKTTSPILWEADIQRLAKHLRLKESTLKDRYLLQDADGDWVMNQSPCPFLQADNHCAVYAHRPRACREYPHTDRKNIRGLAERTLQNAEICPAVFNILEGLAS